MQTIYIPDALNPRSPKSVFTDPICGHTDHNGVAYLHTDLNSWEDETQPYTIGQNPWGIAPDTRFMLTAIPAAAHNRFNFVQ